MGIFLFTKDTRTKVFGIVKIFKKKATKTKFHAIVKRNYLSKITKKYYGNAIKYPLIFGADKPVLTHSDKIYSD